MTINTAAVVEETNQTKIAINAAMDIFHRRWVLRILWELRHQSLNFNALQIACGQLSPTVLNQRLHELREVSLIEHQSGEGYKLTPMGQELLVAMRPMMSWAVRWHQTVNK